MMNTISTSNTIQMNNALESGNAGSQQKINIKTVA
jgi:hypothetical protein